MNTTQSQTPNPLLAGVVAAAGLLLVALLAAFFVPGARAAEGPGRLVFTSGKAEVCRMGACHNFDLVHSITPHGRGDQVIAKVRSAIELASAENGTVAVLSRNVAGGGANADAFTQIYVIGRDGKRRQVFRHRLQGFNATGLGISGNGRLLTLTGKYTADFGSDSKVWLVRADGSGMRQLTRGKGTDKMPALSPDGKRVVYSHTGPGIKKPELFVVNVAGGEPRRLTENGIEDVNPVFSPDGKRIAFGQELGRNHGRVAIVPAAGGPVRTVTSTGGTYADPDWSPNGRSLVFVGETPGRGYDTALYTVRASGQGRTLASDGFEFAALPQWTLRP